MSSLVISVRHKETLFYDNYMQFPLVGKHLSVGGKSFVVAAAISCRAGLNKYKIPVFVLCIIIDRRQSYKVVICLLVDQ